MFKLDLSYIKIKNDGNQEIDSIKIYWTKNSKIKSNEILSTGKSSDKIIYIPIKKFKGYIFWNY